MKRVLVTGASGFIGRPALQHLVSHGYDIHAVGRHEVDFQHATFHRADLLSPGAAASLIADVRPTHLLHLAWYVEPGKFWTAIDNLAWVAASLELFRSFVEGGGQRATFAGSCAEYEWGGATFSETATPSRPRSLYGTAKNALREVVEAAGRELEVSVAWGRVFFLYGPNEPPGRLVSSSIRAILRGIPLDVGCLTHERDYLHVDDVAGALVALLDSAATGIVNIASGRPVSIRAIVATIARLAGTVEPQMLARANSKEEPERIAAKVERLTTEVGFSPRYDLDAGLAATLEWWRKNRQ